MIQFQRNIKNLLKVNLYPSDYLGTIWLKKQKLDIKEGYCFCRHLLMQYMLANFI